MDDQPEVKPVISGLATASLILAFTCVGAPLGLLLGIAAIIQNIVSKKKRDGLGMAVIGIVAGLLVTLALYPTFMRQVQAKQAFNCENNLKQLSTAMMMYADDHNSRFPPAGRWNDAIIPYLKSPKLLKCPLDRTGGPSYAMNGKLSSISSNTVKSFENRAILIFESKPGKNQVGGPELFPTKPRHYRNRINNGEDAILYTDGYAVIRARDPIDGFEWDLPTVNSH